MVGINLRFARENEKVFRNVLRDLRDNRDNRPQGRSIPEDLNPEGPLEDILYDDTKRPNTGRFSIRDVTMMTEINCLWIEWRIYPNPKSGSGVGAQYHYRINPDNSVEYAGCGISFNTI